MRRAPLRDFKREPLQARRRRAGVTRRWHTVDMAITTAIPPDVERPCIADGCGAVAVLTVGAGDPDAFDLCARCATAQERCVTAATLPGGGVAVTTATPGAALATNGIIVLAPARWISDDGAALPRPGHLDVASESITGSTVTYLDAAGDALVTLHLTAEIVQIHHPVPAAIWGVHPGTPLPLGGLFAGANLCAAPDTGDALSL